MTRDRPCSRVCFCTRYGSASSSSVNMRVHLRRPVVLINSKLMPTTATTVAEGHWFEFRRVWFFFTFCEHSSMRN